MTEIIRYQVKIFGGGYIVKDGKPLRFETEFDVEKWILDNQNEYNKRLCSVPIIR